MALIAGAELDPEQRIPRIFSYYAEDDVPENTILEEIQPGYTLNDKVVKHAFVKVSKRKEEV